MKEGDGPVRYDMVENDVVTWPTFARVTVRGPELLLHAGRATKTPTHDWGPRGRDLGMHGVVLLVRGNGRYRDSDGRELEVNTGQLMLLFPGLRHDYGPRPGELWEEAFMDVDGGLVRLLEAQGVLDRRHPVRRIERSAWNQVLRLISDIELGRLAEPRESQWRLHGALLGLAPQTGGDADERALDRARKLLAAHPARPLDVRRAAAAAGMGWELFRKRFRARFGVPPGRYRLHVRCELAAQKLLQPEQTVDEVAEAAGFCDGAHLRRHFRATFGLSPDEFRRLHRPR